MKKLLESNSEKIINALPTINSFSKKESRLIIDKIASNLIEEKRKIDQRRAQRKPAYINASSMDSYTLAFDYTQIN
jgi:hypothetical protein